jgi:hypothetical protein
MLLTTFTLFHVVLSLIGIGAGCIVLFGLLTARLFDGWNRTFLITTAATAVTGFLFPFHQFLPSHALGIVSTIDLALALPAFYIYHLAGGWRLTYVITGVIALYLNVFVLVVQFFLKVPSLKAMAPTQSEPPFAIAQLTVLVVFLVLGTLAAKRFLHAPLRAA